MTHEWKFKASWRGTAIVFFVLAKNLAEAEIKAKRLVKKMDGGDVVIDITFIEKTE